MLRDGDPDRYERAAVRWLARFALEARDVTVNAIRGAAEALDDLPDQPAEAMERLQRLCIVHGAVVARLQFPRARAYLTEPRATVALARHDQRVPASPLALAVVSGLGTALTGGWTAALLILRGPGRAAHALRPTPIAQG